MLIEEKHSTTFSHFVLFVFFSCRQLSHYLPFFGATPVHLYFLTVMICFWNENLFPPQSLFFFSFLIFPFLLATLVHLYFINVMICGGQTAQLASSLPRLQKLGMRGKFVCLTREGKKKKRKIWREKYVCFTREDKER